MSRCLYLLVMLAPMATAQAQWTSLFDGKTLGQWKPAAFANAPQPRVENGAILLPAGHPLTGVTWSGKFPETGYELRFEAERLLGGDFFASVTFQVGASHATWVLGGWGGDIVGISSIDGWDAADNETRTYFNFETSHWYAFRLQVTDDRVMAWIDDQRIVNVEIRGREVSLRRSDMKLTTPLGFLSYNTKGAVRKIEFRPLNLPHPPGEGR